VDQIENEARPDDVDAEFVEVHQRPREQWRRLTPPIQWEVTRRHPLYIQHWNTALKFFGDTHELSDDDFFAAQTAHLQLKMICLPGRPQPPSVEFDSLDETPLPKSLRAGAVRPLTVREAAALLAGNVSKTTLQYIGTLLYEASLEDKEGEPTARMRVLEQLNKFKLGDLDNYLDVPVFTINPNSANSQISDDLSLLLAGFRGGKPAPRNRPDKHKEYLYVWDLREGWEAGGYHPHREMTLREIAEQLGEHESTVSNQYRSAFELIIGHAYTPGRWRASMGPIKLKARFGNLINADLVGPVSRRRPLQSPTRRPVPEGVLSPQNADGPGLVTSLAATDGDLSTYQLIQSMRSLIDNGASDERLAEELGKAPEEIGDFESLRAWFAEDR